MGILPLTALAAGDITGKVINKETGDPMDFVTVQTRECSYLSKPLPIGTNTDENGVFILKGVKDGKYIVKISNVGSIDQERPVEVKKDDIDLGTLRLADDTKLLQEVVVEGIRSQMRFELDKKCLA